MIIGIDKNDVLNIFIKEFKSFLGTKFNDDSLLPIADSIYNKFTNDPHYKHTFEGMYWWKIMINNIKLEYGDGEEYPCIIAIREDE